MDSMAPSTNQVAGSPLHRQPSHWREALFPSLHRPLDFVLPNALISYQCSRVFTADRQVIATRYSFTENALPLDPQHAVLPPSCWPTDFYLRLHTVSDSSFPYLWTLPFLSLTYHITISCISIPLLSLPQFTRKPIWTSLPPSRSSSCHSMNDEWMSEW